MQCKPNHPDEYHRELEILPAGEYLRHYSGWEITPMHLRIFRKSPRYRRLVCYFLHHADKPVATYWQYANTTVEQDYEH